ncbi:MAG: peroxiredoxin-like family protein [Chloroflexi bacterium]|nr:peroxiredoxin-like family protein [Chloroflexota bacterium]
MGKNSQLNFNAPAPEVTLLNTSGEKVVLSDLWKKRTLLLAFTRHFGCTQCKEMLEELVSGRERIEKVGLEIAVITQGTPKITAVFAEHFAPGLMLLSDPDRKAYSAYQLGRGNLFQTFLNREVWRAIRKSQKKGYAIEVPPEGQDAMQMSGTFIIGTDGRIKLPFYYDHIADHPPLDLLLSGVLATKWGGPLEGPIGPGVK